MTFVFMSTNFPLNIKLMLVIWVRRLEETGKHQTTKYWEKLWPHLKALQESEDHCKHNSI